MDTISPGDWLDALCERERLDLVGDLAGGLAHELNNALSIVRGHQDLLLEALEEDGEDRAALGDRARTVCDWTEKVVAAARRLHEVSRHLRQADGPAEAVPLVTMAVGLCDARCQREGILLIWDPKLDVPPGTAAIRVAASPRQVLQVLVHLVGNAREAIARQDRGAERSGATIHITAHQAGAFLRLVVEDDGPGVPAHRTEAIFAPGVTDKAGPGCGYGLPVGRRLAERCGGALRAEAGSTGRFVLDLPLA